MVWALNNLINPLLSINADSGKLLYNHHTMRIYPKLLLLISLLFVLNAHAQTDSAVIKQFIRKQADALAARNIARQGLCKEGQDACIGIYTAAI